ncbi:MAG: hypothetical protein ABI042_05515 [Verrucomicrobiota bacterium]
MKKTIIKLITVCALVAFAVTTTISLRAEDKPTTAAEPKKERPKTFSGKINEIDKAAKTINIGKTKKKTIHITDKTKITPAGKTLDDAKVGDDVGGSYRESADGKMEANSLRIGPKAEGEVKAKAEKKKE